MKTNSEELQKELKQLTRVLPLVSIVLTIMIFLYTDSTQFNVVLLGLVVLLLITSVLVFGAQLAMEIKTNRIIFLLHSVVATLLISIFLGGISPIFGIIIFPVLFVPAFKSSKVFPTLI